MISYGCSCFLGTGPCGWCEQIYECNGCGRILHPNEYGFNVVFTKNTGAVPLCDTCFEDHEEKEERNELDPEIYLPRIVNNASKESKG